MRHTTLSLPANGITSRTDLQNGRDVVSSSVASAPNGFSSASSERIRCATEGATPSSRSAVTARAAPVTRTATGAGRCAAPDTSFGEPIAALIACAAFASSRPSTSSVCSVSARGSTLTVTSVIAASVPHEPAITLQRS